MEDYLCSGEGYFYDPKDPSKCIYGLPPEVEEQRREEDVINSILKEKKNKSRIVKALKIIRQSGARDIKFKIHLLRKLGYSHVKTHRGDIEFGKINEVDYPNIARMYEATIQGLRGLIDNSNKESKLVERLDSFQ